MKLMKRKEKIKNVFRVTFWVLKCGGSNHWVSEGHYNCSAYEYNANMQKGGNFYFF